MANRTLVAMAEGTIERDELVGLSVFSVSVGRGFFSVGVLILFSGCVSLYNMAWGTVSSMIREGARALSSFFSARDVWGFWPCIANFFDICNCTGIVAQSVVVPDRVLNCRLIIKTTRKRNLCFTLVSLQYET